MLALKSTRLSQAGATQIDWGNPICKDLVMVVSANRTWSGTTGAGVLTPVNTPAEKVVTLGKSMGFGTTDAGNTNSYFTGAVLPGITKGARSGIAVILPRSAGGGNIGRVFNNAAGTGIDVANSEGLWMDASNRLLITACATTGTCQIGFTGITLGVWQTVGFSQDRTVINSIPTNVFINGVPSSAVNVNNTNSGSFTSAPQNITIGNRPSDTARTWDGQIALIAYFDRLLSSAELASLTTNPWQIFR